MNRILGVDLPLLAIRVSRTRRGGDMEGSNNRLPSISRLKQRAKKLKKEKGITHAKALELLSKELGYESWSDLLKEYESTEEQSGKYSVGIDPKQNELQVLLDKKEVVESNKRFLSKFGVEFSVFVTTETGLKKSILDATQQVRTHFEIENFHFYENQLQGPKSKVLKPAFLLSDEAKITSKASLYRPVTKQGDPRMWFRKLTDFASPQDTIAIVIRDGCTYLFNITENLLESSVGRPASKIAEFFEVVEDAVNSVAEELLGKLKVLSAKPFPSLRKGDTGVGYTLETLLGIEANSSKKPDYKGIEIKSGRGVKTRTTLFAQVADWSVSPCKKSAEILKKYGYERDGDFKLYCTISTLRENSQGLSFKYNEKLDQLEEWYETKQLVAVWPGKVLRQRLRNKHAETFWVEAKSLDIGGKEFFELKKVIHTKAPVASQLMPLIQQGVITMDHLIKKSGKTQRVSEKGPLFKMNKKDLELLFPEPQVYRLS